LKDHDAGKDVKDNAGNSVTQRIQFPEFVINSITEYSYRLISIGFFVCEYSFDAFPAQVPDGKILIDHPIIPVRKLIPKGIEIQNSNQQRYRKAAEKKLDMVPAFPGSRFLRQIFPYFPIQHPKKNLLPYP
jgi:hypothetical protein